MSYGSAQLTVIAICQILLTLAGVAAVAVLIYAVFSLKKLVSTKVDEALNRVQPIVDQAKSIAEQARDTADKVSDKVDTIVSRAEMTAERVSERVDTLSAKVEEAMSPQMVTAAGIVGTAVKCAQIYKGIVSGKQDSEGSRESDET